MEKDSHIYGRKKFGRLLAGAAVGALTVGAVRWAKAGDSELISPKQELFVGPDTLEQIKEGLRPGLIPQKHSLFIPMLASGDIIPQIIKKEYTKETKYIARKPEFTPEQLLRLTDPKLVPLKVIETDAPLVAITFDDGGDPNSIKKVLEIAQRKGITGTDFMDGKHRKQYPDLVQKLIDSKLFEFGNHTENHGDQRNALYKTIRPTWDEFKKEIFDAETFMNDQFGQTTLPYLRPPGGAADIYTTSWNEQMGFLPLNWWDAIENMRIPPKGAIILAHYRPSSADVFEQWVNMLLSNGLYPTAVSNVIANASPAFWKHFEAA